MTKKKEKKRKEIKCDTATILKRKRHPKIRSRKHSLKNLFDLFTKISFINIQFLAISLKNNRSQFFIISLGVKRFESIVQFVLKVVCTF